MWVRSEYAPELAVLSAWLAALVPWNVTYADGGPLGISSALVRAGVVEVGIAWNVPRFEGPGSDVQEIPADSLRVILQEGAGFSGAALTREVYLSNPLVAGVTLSDAARAPVRNAAIAEGIGGAAVLAAVGLSLAMYAAEEWVAGWPLDEVRLMGGLLGVGAVAFATAVYFYWTGPLPGTQVPVGVLVVGVLAGVLLTVDRTDDGHDGDDDHDGENGDDGE